MCIYARSNICSWSLFIFDKKKDSQELNHQNICQTTLIYVSGISRVTITLLYTALLWPQKDEVSWWNVLALDGHYSTPPDPVGYWGEFNLQKLVFSFRKEFVDSGQLWLLLHWPGLCDRSGSAFSAV